MSCLFDRDRSESEEAVRDSSSVDEPEEAATLGDRATPTQQRLRDRVLAANGVLLVCQRDLDNGRINAANLMPGVVPVRGNSNDLPAGQRHFANENPANLPAADEALRRLRSTCS